MSTPRRSVTTGSVWEQRFGYARAVAIGDQAWVSGTTAGSAVNAHVPTGAGAQAEIAFRVALEALDELGFSAADVVRSRVFLTDMADAQVVGDVHLKVFGQFRPTATMVGVTALVDPQLRVEIELDAARALGP